VLQRQRLRPEAEAFLRNVEGRDEIAAALELPRGGKRVLFVGEQFDGHKWILHQVDVPTPASIADAAAAICPAPDTSIKMLDKEQQEKTWDGLERIHGDRAK
jgi:hypothetical protein